MGRVIVAGGNPGMKVPVTGIQAGTLAVGSVVKLMESGTAVEYLVVNQGIPQNSSLYDSSCGGTWLLRKDIHSSRAWDSSNENVYETSDINTWLNGDFFDSLGSAERASVKQVKIPHCVGGGSSAVKSGVNGLLCKIFLLAGFEVGFVRNDVSYLPIDGAKLDYFIASSDGNSKRIASLNGSAVAWWIRSPRTLNASSGFVISIEGDINITNSYNSRGIRPALVLPSTAIFDETTLQLKGVA